MRRLGIKGMMFSTVGKFVLALLTLVLVMFLVSQFMGKSVSVTDTIKRMLGMG